ncbi:hypothetical protein [Pseudomonas kurunegalensis]|uniref:hypothetical protein n=1 Tax=Pseudomonas kurunegalensis TaxID=485880 RepID=UPI004028916A
MSTIDQPHVKPNPQSSAPPKQQADWGVVTILKWFGAALMLTIAVLLLSHFQTKATISTFKEYTDTRVAEAIEQQNSVYEARFQLIESSIGTVPPVYAEMLAEQSRSLTDVLERLDRKLGNDKGKGSVNTNNNTNNITNSVK